MQHVKRRSSAPPSAKKNYQKGKSFNKSYHETRTIKLEQLDSFRNVSTDELIQGLQRLEKMHGTAVEQLKVELGIIPNALSPKQIFNYHHAISSNLWEQLQTLRMPLTACLSHIIQRDIIFSDKKKLQHRLWLTFHKELEAVQFALKQAQNQSSNAAGFKTRPKPQNNPEALRPLLFCLIGLAEREIKNLANEIDSEISSTEGDALEDYIRKVHKRVLQYLFMSLGDLARYKQVYRPETDPRDWSSCEKLYHRAFCLNPGIAKPWNKLALTASIRKDNFVAFYNHLRGLCSYEEPSTTKEPLFSLHERFKRLLLSLNNGKGEVLPLHEHTHRLLIRFLVACGACIAKIDLSAFDEHLSSTRLHLVMSLQLQLSRSESNSSDALKSINDRKRKLPPHLIRLALMAICTSELCYSAFQERNPDTAVSWTEDEATLNSVRMIFTLLGAMAGTTAAAGFGASSVEWQKATFPAICIFLDLLRCESQFGEGLQVACPEEFRSAMNSVAGLCGVTQFAPIAPHDMPLFEDVECQGIKSLFPAVEARLEGKVDAAQAAVNTARNVESRRIKIARLREFAKWAVDKGWLERSVSEQGNSYKAIGAESENGDESESFYENDGSIEENECSDYEIEEGEGSSSRGSSFNSLGASSGNESKNGEMAPKSQVSRVVFPQGMNWKGKDDSGEGKVVTLIDALKTLDVERKGGDVVSKKFSSQSEGADGCTPKVGEQNAAGTNGSKESVCCCVCRNVVGTKYVPGNPCPFCNYKNESDSSPFKRKQSATAAFVTHEHKKVESAIFGGGILTNVNMDDLAASYPSKPTPRASNREGGRGRSGKSLCRALKPPSQLPHLVVLDAPNVAMRHGNGKKFSARGIEIAANYYIAGGHRVVGFIPQHHLDERRGPDPEEASLLQSMVESGLLVITPSQDYDDSYCITYCKQHNGCVLTNDLYRDHYTAVSDHKEREAARRWIKGHTISFTFVGDEFLPNPDFNFVG
mmetsp:Transcript_4814/g.7288  ORF Transcript_4814/g.7288 Transcript_4814/m.7288 type:complete len:986 (+) Transcript_4814:168-3125(+)